MTRCGRRSTPTAATSSRASYDEWVLAERERLRQRYLDALDRLAARLEAQGDRARDRLRRAAAAADPLREADVPAAHAPARRARRPRAGAAAPTTPARRRSGASSASSHRRRRARRTRRCCRGAAPAGRRRPAARSRRARRTSVAAGRSCGATASAVARSSCWSPARRASARRAWSRSCGPGAPTAALRSPRRAPTRPRARSRSGRSRRGCAPTRSRRRRVGSTPAALAELARVLPELAGRREPLPESEQRQRLFDALTRAMWRPACRCCSSPTTSTGPTGRPCSSCTTCCAARPRRAAARRRDGAQRGARPRAPERAGRRPARHSTASTVVELGRALARGDRRARGALTGADWTTRPTPVRRDRGQPAVRRRDAARRLAGGASPRVQAVIEARLAQLSGPARGAGRRRRDGRARVRRRRARRARRAGEPRLVSGLDELWRRRIVARAGARRLRLHATTRSARSPTAR